jgi:phospholipid/cholesterol/gamma-HCH transport system substrate-binding protein
MSVSHTNRWKLGLFVTVGLALLIAVLMWTGVSQMQRRTFPAYFYFDETVNGLELGSPVKFRGVVVGRVDHIDPAPDMRHVEVRTGLYVDALGKWGISPSRQRREGRAFVHDDLRGQLRTSALTQVSFIQIDFFDEARYPIPEYKFAVQWETIHTVSSTFKSLETGLMEAIESWPEVTRTARELMTNLNQGVTDLELATLSAEFQETLIDGRALMARLEDSPLVDGSSPTLQKFQTTLDELSGLARELRGEGGQIDRVVDRFDSLGEAIQIDFENSDLPGAVAAVRAAGSGMSGAGEELTALLRDLRIAVAGLETTLASVASLADVLSREPGALLHGKTTPTAPFDR